MSAANRGPVDPRWLVSPWFDLLFVANLGWLLAWLPGLVAADVVPDIQFWQIYFLTTPHRWLTLVLVATDPDRRAGRTRLFVGIAIAGVVLVYGAWLTTGEFFCLAVLDYLWNAWHFGSQHGGILRMYSRRVGGGRPRLENITIRILVCYTAIRLVADGWLLERPFAQTVVRSADLLVLALTAFLMGIEWINRPHTRPGKVIYLSSVCALYAGLIMALRHHHHALIAPLVVASAAFHAVEYMAIVTFYAWRRAGHGSASLFQRMARNWLAILAAFVIIWGLFSTFATNQFHQLWFGLNLWAAFMHYAYDGLIWKLRKPETARALDVEIVPATRNVAHSP